MNGNADNNKNLRPYPDWMSLTSKRFHEIRSKGNDWYFYYNMDWEDYLFYCMILHNKDYQVKGGMPQWLRQYIDAYEVKPFDYGNRDITLVFYKEKWVHNTLTFYLEDRVTEHGMAYNVSSVINPAPEFLEGKNPPGRAACPQSVWQEYVIKHVERLKSGNEWNPEIK